MLPRADYVALGVVLSLPAVIGWRHRWLVLYEFEAGLASVGRYRRRVTVLRWADLAAVREDTGQDQEILRLTAATWPARPWSPPMIIAA